MPNIHQTQYRDSRCLMEALAHNQQRLHQRALTHSLTALAG
ncbi:MAG: hypothetical protein NW220_01305 [Leptolyngbyaceae cyanobacterium bins.349]|nr:hypothetical protein [Leptolyngbyaceae cyanobacterium bins.349]